MRKLNSITRSSVLLAALLTSASVIADNHVATTLKGEVAEAVAATFGCAIPTAPIIPDGNVASEDELVAASKAIKGYQATLEEYRDCLQKADAEIADRESEAGIKQITDTVTAFNASVESEEVIAAEFNTAVRAFKAKTPQ